MLPEQEGPAAAVANGYANAYRDQRMFFFDRSKNGARTERSATRPLSTTGPCFVLRGMNIRSPALTPCLIAHSESALAPQDEYPFVVTTKGFRNPKEELRVHGGLSLNGCGRRCGSRAYSDGAAKVVDLPDMTVHGIDGIRGDREERMRRGRLCSPSGPQAAFARWSSRMRVVCLST